MCFSGDNDPEMIQFKILREGRKEFSKKDTRFQKSRFKKFWGTGGQDPLGDKFEGEKRSLGDLVLHYRVHNKGERASYPYRKKESEVQQKTSLTKQQTCSRVKTQNRILQKVEWKSIKYCAGIQLENQKGQ